MASQKAQKLIDENPVSKFRRRLPAIDAVIPLPPLRRHPYCVAKNGL